MANYGTFVGGPVASAGGLGTRVGVAFVSLTTDNSGLRRGFAEAQTLGNQWVNKYGTTLGSRLAQSGRQLQAVGTTVSRYVSLPLAAAAGAATKFASDFQTAMQRTVALSGIGANQVGRFADEVKRISGLTARDPREVADALYFVASAGLKASQVLPVLEKSAKGATAGLGTTQVIGQTLTSVLNAYANTNLTAAKSMDILTEAVRQGKAEPEDLANTIGAVIPVAANMGVAFEQVASAIAVATNYGVEAHRAVTGLRYLLVSIQNPTEASKKVLANYGLSIGQVQKSLADPSVGLLGTLQMLAKTFDITSVKGREAWQTVIGGVRGSILANTLVGENMKRNESIFAAVGRAAGNAGQEFEKAFGIMQQSPQYQFQKAWNDLKIAAIDAGKNILPVAEKIVEAIGGVARGFSALPDSVQRSTVAIGLFLIALGPVTTAVGLLARGLGNMLGLGARALQFASGAATVTGELRAQQAGSFMAGGLGRATASTMGPARAGVNAFFASSPLLTAIPFVAAITLSAIAMKKVVDLMHQGDQYAEKWAKDLESGKTNVEDLVKTVNETNQTGTGWLGGIPVLSKVRDMITDIQVTKAATVALQKYGDALDAAIVPALGSGRALTQFYDALTTSGIGSIKARTQLADYLGTLDDLGAHLPAFQAQMVQAAIKAGNFGAAQELIGSFMKDKLSKYLDDVNAKWADNARKLLAAAKNGHDVLDVLQLIEKHTQFKVTRYEKSIDAVYKGALDTFEKTGAISLPRPGGMDLDQLYHMIRESKKLDTQDAVKLLSLLADPKSHVLADMTKRTEAMFARAVKTGNADKLLGLLQKQTNEWYKNDRAARQYNDALNTTLTNSKALADLGPILGYGGTGGPIFGAGKGLTPPEVKQVAGVANAFYAAGGELSRKGLTFINEAAAKGQAKRIINYIEGLARKLDKPHRVTLDMSEATRQLYGFITGAESQSITVPIYLKPLPRNTRKDQGRPGGNRHHGGRVFHDGGPIWGRERDITAEVDEYVVRAPYARRNQQLLDHINRYGRPPAQGYEHHAAGVDRGTSARHQAQIDTIADAVRELAGAIADGGIHMDGHRVGTLLAREQKRRLGL